MNEEIITSRIMLAVGAIIEDAKGRVLLVRHKPERGGFWQGRWICPGGELELGETIEEGIKREVREETGLEVELVKPLPAFERIVKSAGGISLHVVYIDYIAKLVGGRLKVDSDIGDALWVGKDEIPRIWDELHEDTQRLFELARVV
ncbi:MAG TPA: NUDIX hydrolase [Dehalococcoidia bacterium]|nr:NUDIX hydrolase [Dehalococcoidia bacterium]